MEHISFWSMLIMLLCWEENINTIKRNTEALLEVSRKVSLEVNTGKSIWSYLVRIKS
jgi:hypothetical protein